MTARTHPTNCANAKNPGCRCSYCLGALHGWQGWTRLARAPRHERDVRRRDLVDGLGWTKRGTLRATRRNRAIHIDLVRLGLAGTHADQAGHRDTTDIDHVDDLGTRLMAETWPDVADEIDKAAPDRDTAKQIKKTLADHAWCTLLVALVKGLELIETLSGRLRLFIREQVLARLAGPLGTLAAAVTDILINQVWAALIDLSPLGEQSLRALRILALFACPSVESHPDVYRHAVRPLLEDGTTLISEEVKTATLELFASFWARRAPEALA
ncbi:hypothetical protein [Actinoplanes derwentensis]|uniref:Uncharacterized protein n=1 Tax=Actinoplanes derwentensis TaxID=113562 RepID=A0A1H1TZR9_9ACTN|nr:hypothetical protein [Actinoplanes derwentensis]GID89897.1 hypothetical protein Ade03nite_88210 [Actinoplanes derwentensis]SDS65604.1 hypothetical protein SAMN04489716_1286 [Actinoplanes derwentensis]